jgi:E3 ubiquitin-protein ligase TRIP12
MKVELFVIQVLGARLNMYVAQDSKLVDNACLALTRIAEALAHSPEHMTLLGNCGLITTSVQLVSVSEAGGMTSQLSLTTYYNLIKLLTVSAKGSASVAENILSSGISSTIHSLISK